MSCGLRQAPGPGAAAPGCLGSSVCSVGAVGKGGQIVGKPAVNAIGWGLERLGVMGHPQESSIGLSLLSTEAWLP